RARARDYRPGRHAQAAHDRGRHRDDGAAGRTPPSGLHPRPGLPVRGGAASIGDRSHDRAHPRTGDAERLMGTDLAEALTGRYTIERELGRGGMATVHLARDVRNDRHVALKVLHPQLAFTLGADRFAREIRLAARLVHPNILPVLDSGDVAGQLWFAMPYVEGENLFDRLQREHQLPVAQALRIALRVAGALAYANEQGVVHRDIKPDNILLSGDSILVADFGVARAVSEMQSKLTATGMIVGTPTYMSPEQAAGEMNLDGRSDIFALAC